MNEPWRSNPVDVCSKELCHLRVVAHFLDLATPKELHISRITSTHDKRQSLVHKLCGIRERQRSLRKDEMTYYATFVHLKQRPRELNLFQYFWRLLGDIHQGVFILFNASNGDMLGGIRQVFGMWMVPNHAKRIP